MKDGFFTRKQRSDKGKKRGRARMRELGGQVYTPVAAAKSWRGANEAGVELYNLWPIGARA